MGYKKRTHAFGEYLNRTSCNRNLLVEELTLGIDVDCRICLAKLRQAKNDRKKYEKKWYGETKSN